MKDVECPIILVVMQPSEEVQRCASLQGVRIATGEKHDGRLVLRCALQVIQHVVRTYIGEDLADT